MNIISTLSYHHGWELPFNCPLFTVVMVIYSYIDRIIPGSSEDTDKLIEVAYGHHVTAKQKVSVRIQMCDDNGKKFVATLYNVLLAPDLCDRPFSIIMLMNDGHTCLFHKGFCTVYFGAKEDNAVTLPHSAV